MPRRRKKRKQKNRRRKILLYGAGIFALALVFALAFGIQTVMALMNDLPKLNKQDYLSLGQTSRVYAADGSLIAEIHGTENRTVVPLNAIPKDLRNATIAIEDQRFYQHGGVDYEGIVRAAFADLSQGRIAEGGSTITQQLVKALYVSDKRSFTRKLEEAVLATELERIASKDEILDRYLNTVYYGDGAYGVEAAAQTYFGKDVTQLNLAECAMLAGLPQAPSDFSPKTDLKAATDRRNTVLQKMADLGYINQATAHGAASMPVDISHGSSDVESQPYFVEYVKQQLIDKYGEEKVFEGGLKVYTTIDPQLQSEGQQAIKKELYEDNDPAAALVSIDPSNGYIRAMVSSQDYNTYKFNLAVQAKRQPGSCFKPFVLTAAVEQGADPAKTFYMSKPIDIPMPGGGPPWHVGTYNLQYYGVSSLEEGMFHSDNTVYAQLVMDIGADKVRDVAQRLGITSPITPNPSIALGGLGQGVSPLEMASAYATLAANGKYEKPISITKVEMPDGQVDFQANPQPKQVVQDGVAWTVTQVLKGDLVKGVDRTANINRPAAGKTGSTENLQDAWFVGYTPDIATAVWVGYPNGSIPMTDVHGGPVWADGIPAYIWRGFMESALKNVPPRDFPLPQEKPQFKKLSGKYVLFSGGDQVTTTPRDDAYGSNPPADGQSAAGSN